MAPSPTPASSRWGAILDFGEPAVYTGGAAILGAVMFGLPGATVGAAAGASLALFVRQRRHRLLALRQTALLTPFPERWRRILMDHSDHYRRLPTGFRGRFEDHVRLFLASKRISGVGLDVTDTHRLLVASSAATLSMGWDGYGWDQLAEVLLYAKDFDRDYSFDGDELSGQAHPWGTVILSAPSLLASFEDPDDGYHVGLHEFAHLLDADRSDFDGIPSGLDEDKARAWLALVRDEMDLLRHGRSVIDPYGDEDPSEFLAVAVEAFFERPLPLRRRHGALYAMLRDYFGQDPAAWDEDRGHGEKKRR